MNCWLGSQGLISSRMQAREAKTTRKEVEYVCVHCSSCYSRMFTAQPWAEFSNSCSNSIAALWIGAQDVHKPHFPNSSCLYFKQFLLHSLFFSIITKILTGQIGGVIPGTLNDKWVRFRGTRRACQLGWRGHPGRPDPASTFSHVLVSCHHSATTASTLCPGQSLSSPNGLQLGGNSPSPKPAQLYLPPLQCPHSLKTYRAALLGRGPCDELTKPCHHFYTG